MVFSVIIGLKMYLTIFVKNKIKIYKQFILNINYLKTNFNI